MKKALLSLVLLAVAATSALGQIASLDKRVVNIQTSPVRITNVEAGFTAPTWMGEGNWVTPQVPCVPLYLQVQNTSERTVYAYNIMVAVYDAFGNYIDTIRASCATALAPQATDVGRWSLPVRNADAVWTVLCYVDAVRFQDGGVWSVDPLVAAALVPSTAPVRFHSWHIVPDPREVLAIKMKDLPAPMAPAVTP